jgi:hypothetical protein
MTTIDDTPCLIDSYPWSNVVWAHGSEHLMVSNKRDLWHWTPISGKFSFFLTLEIPGYVSLHDVAQIFWSPDDRLIACISGITSGEVSRPKGMRWDKHAHWLVRRSVADLAFIDVERSKILSRFQFKTIGLLEWSKSSELAHIRVRDESHGDPYICYVIDPRTGDREQGSFPAD